MIKVNFEVNPKEYEILKKSLYNYKGRLIHVMNNACSHEDHIKANSEMKTLEKLIREMEGEDFIPQVNNRYRR